MKICLTGGGTLGHITPNVMLADTLYAKKVSVVYIGSKNGMEAGKMPNFVQCYSISCGKLHRYFTRKNFSMIFKTIWGVIESLYILRKENPQKVFSSGGYVGLPVVLAAFILRIPVIVYDADASTGLANGIAYMFASAICVNFAPLYDKLQAKYNGKKKVELVGPFIRGEFCRPDPECVRKELGFSSTKPVLLVFGGSQGAEFINNVVLRERERLMQIFQIIHVFGKGKMKEGLSGAEYKTFESIDKNFASYMALADMVVCRAGATTIMELLFLRKTHILIPMSLRASRGDQMQNAEYFAARGASVVMSEEQCFNLCGTIETTWSSRSKYITAMEAMKVKDATSLVASMLMT